MENDRLDAALSRLYHTPDAPESFETGWRGAVRREESIRMMNRTPKRSFSLRRAVPVLTALVLIAGGLWAGMQNIGSGPAPAPAAMNKTMVMSSRSTADTAVEEAAEYSMDSGAVYGMAASGSTSSALTAAPEAQDSRKIVRTADLTLRTAAFDEALENAQNLLGEMGGYVENLYQYGENARRVHLSMRVPSQKLDEFIFGAEGLGRVTDRSESSTDMTTQYVDNQARLNTLYAKRDRLNELLLRAENVSDLIEIESAIADTQYQIDSYETSQRSIDSRVDMSQVNLTIIEETPASTVTADVSLAERLSASLTASVEWLGEFLRDVLVFIAVALPVAIPVGLIALVWALIRRRRKNKEA